MNGLPPAKRAKTQPAPAPSPAAKHWTPIFQQWFPGCDNDRCCPCPIVPRKIIRDLFHSCVEDREDQAAAKKKHEQERMLWLEEKAVLRADIRLLQRDIRHLVVGLRIHGATSAETRRSSSPEHL